MKRIKLAFMSVLAITALTACSTISSKLKDTADSLSSASSEASSEKVESDFVAADTSDATIESMVTYSNYLDMYQKILDEYYTDYGNAIAGTALDDGGATIEKLKQENQAVFDRQKAQYDSIKDTKIVGKDTLVKFLKDYRDNLKQTVDTVAASLQ